MIIVRSPFRISFFGGSTDYKDFYESHGSFIIGTTIDKHIYLSMRMRPSILGKQSVITYSKMQIVDSWDDVHNPLIREILKYKKVERPIEFHSVADVPSRTGLGGSSTFCIGMLHLLGKILNEPCIKKSDLAKTAIYIERNLLNESGGIQDQIWPAYGGLNTLEIRTDGSFYVKPLSVTTDFKTELQDSILLIYSNNQREQDSIAASHEHKDKTSILSLAKAAHGYFINENIEMIGKLLYESWKEKMKISNLITTSTVNDIVNIAMSNGAYGAKLLGSGGCGFVMVLCNSLVKTKLKDIFKDNILDFKFDNDGVKVIYNI